MKTDLEIKEDILAELNWLPHIDETQIGVVVLDGVVTLTGLVFTYAIKMAVEEAVKHVSGVKAIAEDINVGYISSRNKTDLEIANTAVNALEWNASVPNGKIVLEVEDGWINLSGEVEWSYQRDAAKRTIEYLEGVKGVTNNIQLKPKTTPTDVTDSIEKAYKRSANIDAKNICTSSN